MAACRALPTIFLLTLAALPTLAQEERPTPAGVPAAAPVAAPGQLRDGVVLDAERASLYAMRPGGGVMAIRLVDGELLWESGVGARPLALAGATLLVAGEGAEEATTLDLTLLDVANRGRLLARVEAPLDAAARTLIDDGLGTRFRMQATVEAGRAIVLWHALRQEIPGALLVEDAATAPVAEERLGGWIVDLGRPQAVPIEVAAFPDVRFVREAPAGAAPPGPGPLYLSADDRHLATSERVARDPEWNQYRWTVRETATGATVGTFDHPVAIAPFVVAGSTLVLETRPFQRREASGLYLQEPLALRGIDLATGRELWQRAIRDVAYYGPYPP